jgi:endoglucanase
VEMWRALSARYANARSLGGYDLLNEPMLPQEKSGLLPALYQQIASAIRSVDPNHLLILEGNDYAHDFTNLRDFSDSNVMYEFHEYAIFNRKWKRPNPDALAPFLELRAATGHPLWLGEFGENTLEWQASMVQLMRSNNIGWAVWPWKRIDLGNHHPVIETIQTPDSWKQISGYLVGRPFARKPSVAQAEQAMSDMLEAVKTENCREDAELERVLAGR